MSLLAKMSLLMKNTEMRLVFDIYPTEVLMRTAKADVLYLVFPNRNLDPLTETVSFY